MNLVLVESPAKAKTIGKFLGNSFKVEASLGHVRDLPADSFGIDLKNNFQPDYVIPAKAKKTVSSLKKLAEKASRVILATDEDREGEAISWHLAQALGLGNFQVRSTKSEMVRQAHHPEQSRGTSSKSGIKSPKPYERIVFHEITESAIKEALKNPRDININLVNAQQARRILDRIVGYKLSPFLWKKIAQGLSAGRVQSVTVRLVTERENEIKDFKPEEYWTIAARLRKTKNPNDEFEAILVKKDGKIIPKLGIKTKTEAEKIAKELKAAEYQVLNIEKKEIKKFPLPPFTTSTLQQEAWQRFHFPAKFAMSLAQQLYEKGLITYHRTDSLNLSSQSLAAAQEYISQSFGKNYWPGFSRVYKTKSKSAQEAHEAIRPTDPSKETAEDLPEAANKLYDLIWRRFLASQMSEALFDSTIADIAAANYLLQARGQLLKFDGFLKVYPLKFDETELPELEKGNILELARLLPTQHFTQPPSRYSEATLIKALEKFGIGRPSTYAPILDTIQTRGYVKKNEKKLFFPTDIGELVNDILVKHFPQIVDINFTAKMETDLDKISSGEKQWTPVINEFYQPFSQNLKIKEKEVSKKEIMEEFASRHENENKEVCPLCQSPLVLKISRYGKFYACSRFPECKYTKHIHASLGIKCPKCKEGEIVERRTKKRKIFYGCSRWPDCDFALWDKPTGENCQVCGWLLGKSRWGKIKCANPECVTNEAPRANARDIFSSFGGAKSAEKEDKTEKNALRHPQGNP
jgi:DNA topoisomerase-1